MVVEKGYKQTEVGIVPEDWEVKTLGEIGDVIIGLTYSPNDVREFGTLVLRSSNIQNNQLAFENNVYVEMDLPSRVIVKENDLLICVRNGSKNLIGKCAIINKNAAGSAFGAFMSIYRSSSNKYVLHQFQSNSIQRQINERMGATINQITNKDLSGFVIAFPPLPEQTAIASALSDMDALIAQTEKLITKKKAIKQGVMQELLKPKEGWVTKKLGEVCEIIMGQSPLSEYYNFTGIGLPLIQGNADIKNRKTITRTYSSNITKKGKLGDIIMTVRAPVGEIAISSFECCLGRGVCALRYENDFMYHYLISMENYWSRLSSGSTFDSVNSSQIRDLPITLPGTKKEQIEIAKTLTDLDKDIELTETKLQKLKHQKQGMMQALLTGKIRLI